MGYSHSLCIYECVGFMLSEFVKRFAPMTGAFLSMPAFTFGTRFLEILPLLGPGKKKGCLRLSAFDRNRLYVAFVILWTKLL